MNKVKVYLIEANSSVGGLLERLSDMGHNVRITFQSTNDPDFWAIEVEAPEYMLPWIEDAVSCYV